MSRVVPEELKSGTVTIAQASALGVSRRELRGPRWRRVTRGVYRWAEEAADETLPLRVLLGSLPEGSVLSGLSAARLLGLDVALQARPEVVVPPESVVSGRAQATVRCLKLEARDIAEARGLPITSPARTCFDIAARVPLVEATVVVDMTLHAGLLDLDAWNAYIAAHAGVAGVVGARRVAALAEPKSESPMETRLRLLLVLRGLPRPQAQVSLYDEHGAFVARPDLYYPEQRLAIEYDGENHRDRLTSDARRQNRLLGTGVRLLRFTARDLAERPDAVVAEVWAALTRPL